MRKIKFRVWDTKAKKFLEFIPPCEYMLDEECWSHHDLDDETSLTYPEHIHITFNNRLVWQQCTGLNDMDGKEIFEGDVCLYDNTESILKMYPTSNAEIYWNANDCQYIVKNHLFNWNLNQNFAKDSLKVIGNIFENKELLEA